jgi:membrane protein
LRPSTAALGDDDGVRFIDRVVAGYQAVVDGASRRSRTFDHVWRARARYNAELGGRLAAGIAYYAFFAIFALLVLVASVLGFLAVYNLNFQGAVDEFLKANLAALVSIDQLMSNRTSSGILATIGFVFTGIGWVESMR